MIETNFIRKKIVSNAVRDTRHLKKVYPETEIPDDDGDDGGCPSGKRIV